MTAHRARSRRRAASVLASALLAVALVMPSGAPVAVAAAPSIAPLPAVPAEAPVILGPTEGAGDSTEPELSWSAVEGAGHYAVQVAPYATFTAPVYDIVTANLAATPELDLAPGTWHWRVAVDEGGTHGPWAASTFVKMPSLGSPEQTAPADGATFERPAAPTLAWTAVAGAASYELELADNPAMTDPFPAVTRTTSLVASFANPGESFHWRVRAVARNGSTTGAWSAIRSFAATWTGTPTGLAPADGAAVRDLDLSWAPMAGAAGYDLQVTPGPAPDWEAAETRSYTTLTARLQVESPAVPVPSTWAWRVRAVPPDPADGKGAWTAPRLVTRTASPAPVLQAPADGASTGTVVVLSWAPVIRASHYEVQVSSDPTFATGLDTHTTTETTFDLTTAEEVAPYVLVKGTTYHWRVRGIDATVVHNPGLPAGLWSSPRTFAWDPPVATLLTPTQGATVEVPTLTWDPGDARIVRVTVEDAHRAIVARQVTYATSYTPVGALDPADGPFTWYVERVALPGGDGDTVAWRSAERTFTLTAITGAGSTPTPLLPADFHTVSTPSVSWTPVAGADHYRIYLWLHGAPLPDPLITPWTPDLAYPAWTYTKGDLDLRPYAYTVVAFDAAGDVIGIAPEAVFWIDVLPAPVLTAPADCGDDGCPVYADTPRLSWEPVAGADFYGVSYYGPWGTWIYTSATAFTPTADITAGPWGGEPTWSVTACVENRCSPASTATVRIEIPAPAMVGPAAGATVTGPEVLLEWDDLIDTAAGPGTTGINRTEALSYAAGLVGSSASGIIGCCGGSGGDGTTSSLLVPADTYTWELWGYAGGGRPTAHALRTVTVTWAGPVPATPSGGATVARTPNLTWPPAAYADTYEVEVFRGASTAVADRVVRLTTHEAAITPFEDLDAGTYTWRVRVQLQGLASSWGPTSTFTITGPGSPQLIDPAPDGASGTGMLRFGWEPLAGATAYRIQVDDDPAFGSPAESVVTGQPRWAPLAAYPSGTWSWRVQAIGPSGAVLGTSAPRRVSVDLVIPVVTTPVEAIAGAGAKTSPATATPIAVGWTGSDTQAGSVRYDVLWSVDGGAFAPYASSLTSPRIVRKLAAGHSYRFAVRAVDAAGNASAFEYGRTFRVRAFADRGLAVRYRGSWGTSWSTAFTGGTAHLSTAAGASATFRFRGRQVAWVASVGPTRGKARVYVDGHFARTVNLHAATSGARRIVLTRSWATTGDHVLRIVVAGTAGHPRVDVDGFVTIR